MAEAFRLKSALTPGGRHFVLFSAVYRLGYLLRSSRSSERRIGFRPSGKPCEAIPSHEVTALCARGPSGRTQSLAVEQ